MELLQSNIKYITESGKEYNYEYQILSKMQKYGVLEFESYGIRVTTAAPDDIEIVEIPDITLCYDEIINLFRLVSENMVSAVNAVDVVADWRKRE